MYPWSRLSHAAAAGSPREHIPQDVVAAAAADERMCLLALLVRKIMASPILSMPAAFF